MAKKKSQTSKILIFAEAYLKPFLFSSEDPDRIKVPYFWATIFLILDVASVIVFLSCIMHGVFGTGAKNVSMVGLGFLSAVIGTLSGLVIALIALYNKSKE